MAGISFTRVPIFLHFWCLGNCGAMSGVLSQIVFCITKEPSWATSESYQYICRTPQRAWKPS
eukprot:9038828-Karenia_brevis.AAC.1